MTSGRRGSLSLAERGVGGLQGSQLLHQRGRRLEAKQQAVPPAGTLEAQPSALQGHCPSPASKIP